MLRFRLGYISLHVDCIYFILPELSCKCWMPTLLQVPDRAILSVKYNESLSRPAEYSLYQLWNTYIIFRRGRSIATKFDEFYFIRQDYLTFFDINSGSALFKWNISTSVIKWQYCCKMVIVLIIIISIVNKSMMKVWFHFTDAEHNN